MKKLLKIVGMLCCLIFSTVFIAGHNNPNDKSDYYSQLIHSLFGIELNETNSQLVCADSILSRDSIYMVRYHILPETNVPCTFDTWNTALDSSTIAYISVFGERFDGVKKMIQASKNGVCYFKEKIRIDQTHDYIEEVAILMVNPIDSEMYFFYILT